MDLTNLYSAEKAKNDWEKRANAKEAYVDEDKILFLLDDIKTKIHKLDINSKNGNIGQREYNCTVYLSPGEQKLLKELGYKVEYEDDDGMNGSYFRIKW